MRLKEEIHGVRSGRRRRKASMFTHTSDYPPSSLSPSISFIYLLPTNTLTRSLNHLSLSSATFEFLWKHKCDMKLAKRLHTLLSLSHTTWTAAAGADSRPPVPCFLLYAPVSCWCKGQSERTLYWHETKQGWEYMFVYGVCVHKHVAASRHPYKLPTPFGGSSSFRETYSNTEKQAVMVSKIEKVLF